MEQYGSPENERNWAFIFSPFLIVAILSALAFIFLAVVEDGMGAIVADAVMLPILMIALFMDISFKIFLNRSENRGKIVWIAQSILILAAFIVLWICVPV